MLESIKEKARTIWNTYDNTYGYVTEKLEYMDSIKLEEDAYIIRNMFDIFNQFKLYQMLTEEEKQLIGKDAMEFMTGKLEDLFIEME